jgi:phosphatidylglycerophosphate synthase
MALLMNNGRPLQSGSILLVGRPGFGDARPTQAAEGETEDASSCRLAYDSSGPAPPLRPRTIIASIMNDTPDDPLPAILPAGWQDAHRLALSAALNIIGVGAALLLGAFALARLVPIGGGHLYFYKALGGYLLLLLPMLAFLHTHRPHTRFGSANTVTLIRAAIVCLLASLYGEPWSSNALLVACVAIFALTLDGVDGWLARLRGTQSRFGARFDMETDALLVLVLSLLAWQSGHAGAWVLVAGLMRYAFVAAAMLWRWLERPLPASQRRKTICVLQLVALIACVAPLLPDSWRVAAAADAVLMVAISFAVDVAWLYRHRHRPLADADATG